ncbi:hypothetical protein RPMA_06670 [Tardiphaga alba]|uniref:Uncharacterized protein n=1 Tax=Tardiphaga alba TaxID=340268 RepID=A0ABX8A4G2_9BRAD|nr:DUF6492 family protein [Tardiphaga alba]QUS38551.1 hypothetical protein RPMA_06670 [Tardiphaga alba]
MTRREHDTVSLITPSYRGDLERSALLFESVDRFVSSFERHYVIVHDEDLALFKPFHGGRRVVMRASELLPTWLHEIPLLRWRRRRYWWSLRAKPVSGWHTQQLVKIKAAAVLPEDRYCLIDSDNVFFRPFDVATIAPPHPPTLRINYGHADDSLPGHQTWVRTARDILGMPAPTFPADDFIDQIIIWDKQIVQAMIARIETVTGREWSEALCRARDFSEYMTYGNFVMGTDALRDAAEITTESLSNTHWTEDVLSPEQIMAMIASASPRQVSLCIQSFNKTPVSQIRDTLHAYLASQSNAAA